MPDNRATGGTERSSPMPGTGGNQGEARTPGSGGAQGTAEHLYDQARDAVSGVADHASEMWDDAYDQGERYYRQGSRALGNVDGSTLTIALVAGAVRYGLAYLMHGQQSYSGREHAPEYGRTRAGSGRSHSGHGRR